MKISAKEWFLFIAVAAIFLCIWYGLESAHFSVVDLSLDRQKALQSAERFLALRGVDTKTYLKSVTFDTDEWVDRYLQMVLGLKGEDAFIKGQNYELFFWRVRFFRELQKEEYIVYVSAKSAKILSFHHLIEDIEPRPDLGKERALALAEGFLRKNFAFDSAYYKFHEEHLKRYDKRVDYTFSWEKLGVNVSWNRNEGEAKLLTGVTVSGDEIRKFYENSLDIPEKFKRFVDKQIFLSDYLSSIFFALFTLILVWAMYVVVKRKDSLVMRIIKKWFLFLALFFFVINLSESFNKINKVMNAYNTSSPLYIFLGYYFMEAFKSVLFVTVAFIMPALAGESVIGEVFPGKKYSSFLHYIRAGFYNRSTGRSVFLGYLISFMIVGFQAVVFYFGQKYFGVWRQWEKLTQFSSEYLPVLGAFVIAATASISEELIFRLCGINLFKKYLKNTILAVIFSALIWGLGHTAYAVFPVWFRIIEVGLLGVFFGFIFVRYGLIPLIIAHYLFNLFLGIAPYLLGHTSTGLFISSSLALLLPLGFGLLAYFLNQKEQEKDLKPSLNKTQEYNLGVLVVFVSRKKTLGMDPQAVRKELIGYNWDPSLVEMAIKEVFAI